MVPQRGLLLFFLLGFFFIGCGGGTTGTGSSGRSEFSGKVISFEGRIIAGAVVTIEETGESSRSDSEGRFSIETEYISAHVTLLVESETVDDSVRIDDLPVQPVVVSLVLKVEEQSNQIEIDSIEVKPRHQPTPQPTSTSQSTPTPQRPTPTNTPQIWSTPRPRPSPTPVLTGIATLTPSSYPTIAATPTEIPTVTLTPTSTPAIRAQKIWGVVNSSDRTLLADSVITLGAHKPSQPLNSSGEFAFLLEERLVNPQIKIAYEKGSARITLEGVSKSTYEVRADIQMEPAQEGIKLSLNSLEILNDPG